MYRFKRVVIKFIPSQIAVTQTAYQASGSTIGTVYTSNNNSKLLVGNPTNGKLSQNTWELAFGFTRDPTVGPLNFTEVIQSGGRVVNALRGFSFPINFRCPWLYTGFSADFAGLTPAEVRQMFFGQLNAVWKSVPVANAQNVGSAGSDSDFLFGEFWCQWDIEFKFPIDTSSDDPIPPSPLLFHKQLLSSIHTRRRPTDRDILDEKLPGPSGLAEQVSSLTTVSDDGDMVHIDEDLPIVPRDNMRLKVQLLDNPAIRDVGRLLLAKAQNSKR